MMEHAPTSILSAGRCQLGEGPTYDAATDTAWFDILEGRLFEAHLGSARVGIHRLGKMASALARLDAERQLIVTEDGLYIVPSATDRWLRAGARSPTSSLQIHRR